MKMEDVEEVGSYKYLGVHIDEDLTFNTHISYVIKNVAHKLYLLCKIRSKISRKASLDIYKAMILPLLDVGDIFYHGASQVLINEVESLQKPAIRIALSLPRMASVQNELGRYNLLTLEKRRKVRLAQLARWMAKKTKYHIQTSGSTRSHANNRMNLKVIYPRKNKVQRSFLYQSTNLWNSLPTYLHCLTKPETFKKEFIEYMQSG